MIYQIVLKSGQELDCIYSSLDNILDMICKHDIYLVQENIHSDFVSYINKEDVSYFRFPTTKHLFEPVV